MRKLAGSSIKMVPLGGVGTVGGLEKIPGSLRSAMDSKIADRYQKSTVGEMFKNSANSPSGSSPSHTNNINNNIRITQNEINNGRALAGNSHTIIRDEAEKLVNNAYNSANSNNLQGAQDTIGSLAKTLLDIATINGRRDEKLLAEAIRRAGLNGTSLGFSIYQAGKNGQGSNKVIQDMGSDMSKLMQELKDAQNKQKNALNDQNAAYTGQITQV